MKHLITVMLLIAALSLIVFSGNRNERENPPYIAHGQDTLRIGVADSVDTTNFVNVAKRGVKTLAIKLQNLEGGDTTGQVKIKVLGRMYNTHSNLANTWLGVNQLTFSSNNAPDSLDVTTDTILPLNVNGVDTSQWYYIQIKATYCHQWAFEFTASGDSVPVDSSLKVTYFLFQSEDQEWAQ